MIKCRNFLCREHCREDKNGCGALIQIAMCYQRKAFERIVREGHGAPNTGIADEARGARLMMDMEEARKR